MDRFVDVNVFPELIRHSSGRIHKMNVSNVSEMNVSIDESRVDGGQSKGGVKSEAGEKGVRQKQRREQNGKK